MTDRGTLENEIESSDDEIRLKKLESYVNQMATEIIEYKDSLPNQITAHLFSFQVRSRTLASLRSLLEQELKDTLMEDIKTMIHHRRYRFTHIFHHHVQKGLEGYHLSCFKVAILGAAGCIGQPLAMLMKMNPLVSVLHLFDVVNVPGVTAV